MNPFQDDPGYGGREQMPIRQHRYDLQIPKFEEKISLSLKSFTGATTTSQRGFAADAQKCSVAYCAGPGTIHTRFEPDLSTIQRLYRANPNAIASQSQCSVYNSSTPPTTPVRLNRQTNSKTFGSPGGSQANINHSPTSNKAQVRSRDATCVAIGSNADLLAIGETGYTPRVLIFSTASGASTSEPLSILTDHSFGVLSLAFSSDCQWLATLGNSFDGFLLLYKINVRNGSAVLHSSNRCSNVNNFIWMGKSILSFGNRHVKVWKTDDAMPENGFTSATSLTQITNTGPILLEGRNCILGSLLNLNYVAAATISDTQALVGSANGHICLLQKEHDGDRFNTVQKIETSITSIYYDAANSYAHITSTSNILYTIRFPESAIDLRMTTNIELPIERFSIFDTSVFAINSIGQHLVTIDKDHVIDVWRNCASDPSTLAPERAKRFTAHDSAVYGTCSVSHWNDMEAAQFITFSSSGLGLLWDTGGVQSGQIALLGDATWRSDEGIDELRCMAASVRNRFFFVGTKFGQLGAIAVTGATVTVTQAHQGEINAVTTAFYDEQEIICTCGRDRTIQIFERTDAAFQLCQTLIEHSGSVINLELINEANILLSMSADRTIIIRKALRSETGALAYLPVRTISLKTAPLAFGVPQFDSSMVVVSTLDRQISRYDISTGRLLHCFKPTDPVSGDSVTANTIKVCKIPCEDGSQNVLIISSQSDKSIRLYDFSTSCLITRQPSQSSICAINLIEPKVKTPPVAGFLVACSMDATVLIHDINVLSNMRKSNYTGDHSGLSSSPLRQSMTPGRPVRKTLTRTELASFQKALEPDCEGSRTPPRSLSPVKSRSKSPRKSMAFLGRTDGNKIVQTPPSPDLRVTLSSHRRKTAVSKSDDRSGSSEDIKPLSTGKPVVAATNNPDPDEQEFTATANKLREALRLFRLSVPILSREIQSSDCCKSLQNDVDALAQFLRSRDTPRPEKPLEEQKATVGGLKDYDGKLDEYLARMIDSRLALLASPGTVSSGSSLTKS